jgi:hypothetical protein
MNIYHSYSFYSLLLAWIDRLLLEAGTVHWGDHMNHA